MAESTKTNDEPGVLDEKLAWECLLQFSAAAKAGNALESGGLEPNSPIVVDAEAERSWRLLPGAEVTAEAASMLDLYMPLCVGSAANTMVAAHLGQTLDGRIATLGGASQFITGEENLVHTHRMRALFDAVVVGARTATQDNPRLTTRLTSGDNATRVLIDPSCSASANANASIFVDGVSETLVICEQGVTPTPSAVTHIGLASDDGTFAPDKILAALRARGLRRIFVEGGGITVSRFLRCGVLDRLHICVAPMILGSGRPAIALPEVETLSESHFLKVRHFPSGSDLLFDCQLRNAL